MTTFNFDQKVAVITGAGTGIGLEIARQLSAGGADVILNDIDENKLIPAVEVVKKSGGRCESVAGDASDLDNINQMVGNAVSSFGHLDMIVANAGVTSFGDFLNYSLENFRKLIAVNLQGSFFLAQRGAKEIIKQKSGGKILLMSSVTGHQTHPNLTAYGMTKAALEMLAKSLAVELAPHQITVNAVAPGATITERTIEEDPDYKKIWENIIPLGKVASTADIAHAALFLLSEQSGHVTGQSIVVDGGWTSYSPTPGYLQSKE